MECYEGTCQCEEGYQVSNETGESVAQCSETSIGDPCAGDRECGSEPENIVCESAICTCNTEYIQVDDSTCRAPGPGDPCDTVTTCNKTSEGGICLASGVCGCSDAYQESTDGTTCLYVGASTADSGGDSLMVTVVVILLTAVIIAGAIAGMLYAYRKWKEKARQIHWSKHLVTKEATWYKEDSLAKQLDLALGYKNGVAAIKRSYPYSPRTRACMRDGKTIFGMGLSVSMAQT